MATATGDEVEPRDRTTTNLIINYLPQSMTDSKLHTLFSRLGQIKTCRVMKDVKTNYSYGYGFVDFVCSEDASRAVEVMNGLQVENKRIKVSFARPAGKEIKDTNLFIQNLPKTITDQELENLFAPYGQIVQKHLLKNLHSGLPRGVAFVRYNKKEDAQKAINQLNGILLEGCKRSLSVKIAEDHGKQKAAYLAGLQTGLRHRGENGNTLTYT